MSDNPFAALGLRNELVETLATLGYEAPTPIQERTVPILLAGRDLIGQAQTGTGKTAAFALPMLQAIDPKNRKTQALVLAPTRELAMQVADAIHTYAQKLGAISVLPVYGGAPIVHQLKRLERGAQVVVGTPGRLIDHLDRGSLQLQDVRMLVLDEADEMLKMGFIEDIEKILYSSPAERQTALFSATMPPEVMRIAQKYLREPERVEIEHRALTAPAIEQRFLNVSEGQKLEVLTRILELEQGEAVLIFRRTKTGAAELAEKLEGRGFSAVAMHGDMNQPARESVIRRLRAGQIDIVVATDVAARGLDVEQITHVVNYDVPYDVEAYVHRIGRTGRAGRSGVATLFITPRERRMMREIERYTGMAIKPMKMPTGSDVAAHRVSLFKESIRKTIQDGDLELYLSLVEELVDEGQHDAMEIAAAAARLATGARRLAAEPEARPQPAEATPSADRSTAAPPPSAAEDRTVTLQLGLGRNDGIRPADVVGSIANEADIPGREIGPIEILDDMTYVGIPERFVELVLEKVGRAKFRGRPVNIRRAEKREGVAPRRAPARAAAPQRPFSGAPERKPFRREGAPPRSFERSEGPRKPFRRDDAPRERSESRPPYRSAAPFRDRSPERDDAPPAARRPYREQGPRKPFREAAGPRKPFRSAPPREDRTERRPSGGAFDRFRTQGPGKPRSGGPKFGGKGRPKK